MQKRRNCEPFCLLGPLVLMLLFRGITNYVQNPPRSLTAALGRDIERYDQLCDSIEAQLASDFMTICVPFETDSVYQHQAISVLRRDLQREEEKKQEEERRKAEEAMRCQPPPEAMLEDTAMQASDTETVHPKSSPISLLGRRQSTVSISSLHRPQVPPRLDLSSSSFRLTEDEASAYQKDLGSPVTLAPKSARPVGANEFPPDLIAAFSNAPMQSDVARGPPAIDLTISDGLHMPQDARLLGLGDSSDRPIELDLDLDIDMNMNMDLFGDADARDEGNSSLLSPHVKSEEDQLQGGDLAKNVLADFRIDSNNSAELFSDFSADRGLNQRTGDITSIQNDASVASAESLLAQFSTSQLMDGKTLPSGNSTLPSSEGFDFDISNLDSGFLAGAQDVGLDFTTEMESIMNIKVEKKE